MSRWMDEAEARWTKHTTAECRAADRSEAYDAEIEDLKTKNKRLRAAIRSVIDDFERAIHAARPNRGGQHVPYHGPFASGPPSTISALARMARDLREALEYQWPMLRAEFEAEFPKIAGNSQESLDYMFRDEDK